MSSRATPGAFSLATRRVAWCIVLATTFLIAYGSLFPFEFVLGGREGAMLHGVSFRWTLRGEIVANLLLYMPLGFGLALLVRRGWVAKLVIAGAVGIALSLCIEIAQSYTPARVSTLTDVLLNGIGTLIGAVAGASYPRLAARLHAVSGARGPVDGVALAVAALWLGSRLAPFVPAIEWRKYRAAIEPIFSHPQVSALGVLSYAAAWLVVDYALRCSRAFARPRAAFLLLALAVIAGRIAIRGNALSLSEVVGIALVWPAAALLARFGARRVPALLLLLTAAVVVLEALEPFRFSSTAAPFGWIPFQSSIRGDWEIGYSVLFEKAFWYGALIWLSLRAGLRLRTAAAATAGLLLVLELAQMWVPNRAPEITDPIFAVAIAGAIGLLANRAAQRV